MITRMLFISFFLLVGMGLHGQDYKYPLSEVYYNVEDNTPVCRLDIASKGA